MLNINQKIELLQETIESVQYNLENDKDGDIEEVIIEVVDRFVPWYNPEIVEEWVAMGQPEPDDYTLDHDAQMPIHQLMTVAIMETAREYLYQVIIDFEADWETQHETLRAELERLGVARGYAKLAKAIIE